MGGGILTYLQKYKVWNIIEVCKLKIIFSNYKSNTERDDKHNNKKPSPSPPPKKLDET